MLNRLNRIIFLFAAAVIFAGCDILLPNGTPPHTVTVKNNTFDTLAVSMDTTSAGVQLDADTLMPGMSREIFDLQDTQHFQFFVRLPGDTEEDVLCLFSMFLANDNELVVLNGPGVIASHDGSLQVCSII